MYKLMIDDNAIILPVLTFIQLIPPTNYCYVSRFHMIQFAKCDYYTFLGSILYLRE